MMKDPFLVMNGINTHPRRHHKCSGKEDGFFEGAAEAGFLVTEALARSAVFSGAVDARAPIEVLFEVLLLFLLWKVGF